VVWRERRKVAEVAQAQQPTLKENLGVEAAVLETGPSVCLQAAAESLLQLSQEAVEPVEGSLMIEAIGLLPLTLAVSGLEHAQRLWGHDLSMLMGSVEHWIELRSSIWPCFSSNPLLGVTL